VFIIRVLKLTGKSPYVLESIMIHWQANLKDKLKETGSNKELFDLTNNDRFVSDTRHLMVLAILVMMAR
jgi:hypothetical protein